MLPISKLAFVCISEHETETKLNINNYKVHSVPEHEKL